MGDEIRNMLRLPKWAQRKFAAMSREPEGLRAAHAVLCEPGRDWFTILGPHMGDGERFRYLWVLDRERPYPICSIGSGDLLVIGRAKP